MSRLVEKLLGKTGAEIGVVDDNNTVAGTVVVTQTGRRVKIGNVHVKPGFRGHNLGKVLLGEAEAWAASRGFDEIYGKLEPIPGSEQALAEALEERGYEINRKTGIAKKKL